MCEVYPVLKNKRIDYVKRETWCTQCSVIVFLQREHADALASMQLPHLADSLQELEQTLQQFSGDSVQNVNTS